MNDFTQAKYEELLNVINQKEIKVYGIADYINKLPEKGIILRHDVDRKPQNALFTARLEYKYNIKSTYYFRITKNSFNSDIINKIASLGHEIGYHYEDLSIANGDYDNAIKLFKKHLEQFKPYAKVKTIAMHGRPLSKYDNRDLWKEYNFKDFGLIGEAFLSIDYTNIYYFTDTGRSWAENASNIRDKVATNKSQNVSTTNDLINFVDKNQLIAIVMHPERWALSRRENILNWGTDFAKNNVKNIIKFIRNLI